MLRTATVKN